MAAPGACAQREVGRKLYARLPDLSQLLDTTLARAPKEQFGAPAPQIWQRMVVSAPAPCHPPWSASLGLLMYRSPAWPA